ncbi:hypothetical protein [Nostoc sp. FACHB-133]|nr:hypothetical protein [Nostoc sp. FACHB-133]
MVSAVSIFLVLSTGNALIMSNQYQISDLAQRQGKDALAKRGRK